MNKSKFVSKKYSKKIKILVEKLIANIFYFKNISNINLYRNYLILLHFMEINFL